MKTRPTVLPFIFLVLSACDNSRPGDNQKQETPKALEDKSSSYEIVSKRGYDDLVESLYKQLADKTPELKDFEEKIAVLEESKRDSTQDFDSYNGKNQSYFSSADSHVEQIKDSVLRDRMKRLVANGLAAYNVIISKHNELLTSIETKTTSLADLHTVLKITRMLSLIHSYKKNNLPTTKSLQDFSDRLDETIKLADTLGKK